MEKTGRRHNLFVFVSRVSVVRVVDFCVFFNFTPQLLITCSLLLNRLWDIYTTLFFPLSPSPPFLSLFCFFFIYIGLVLLSALEFYGMHVCMEAHAEEVSEGERMCVVVTGEVVRTNGVVSFFFFFFFLEFRIFGIDVFFFC